MSKPSLAATAEGMPANQSPRDLLSDMEDDMHLVRDHALVLNNALTGTGDLPVKLRHALAHTSCELLGIGEKLAAFHEAMHDALRQPAEEEGEVQGAKPATAVNSRCGGLEDLDVDYSNLFHILSNLHWFMSENMRRATNANGKRVFEIRENLGDEFFAIFTAAKDRAESVMKEMGQ